MNVLFAMLIAQQGGPLEYDLQDWLDLPSYQATHCDPTTGRCDLYPAYEAADIECGNNPPVPGDDSGCIIRFPAGLFRWSQAPDVCRGHSLIGAGGDADAARTVLYSDPDVGCFRFMSYGFCETGGDGAVNGFASSQGGEMIGIACIGDTATATSNVIGVFNESGARIEKSMVRLYVQGIVYDAAVARAVPSNANVFYLADVHAWNNWHMGIHVRGGDVNAFLMLAPDVIDNCKDSSWDSELGECYAFSEQSFLGGTVIGLHVELSGGKAIRLGGVGNNNTRGAMFLPYVEGLGPTTIVDSEPNTQIYGGISGSPASFGGAKGLVILGPRPNKFEFVNDNDPLNRVTLRVGQLAVAGSAWEATQIVPASFGGALRLKARIGTPNVWGWNIGNLSATSDAMQVTMTATTGLPIGSFLVP